MKTTVWSRRGILHGLGAGLLTPAWAQIGVSKANIELGQSASLTGAGNALAVAFHAGAKLYFDRLNVAGGVNGRSINLTTLDDASDPKTAAVHAKKLADAGAFALFGLTGSANVTAANAALGADDILIFAPMAAADELRGANFPRVYSIRPGFSEEAAVMVRHAETLGAKRLAIVHGADAESLSAAEAGERTMTSLGANLLGKFGMDAVAKAVAANPQSVLLVGDVKQAAPAVRELRAKGFRGTIYGFSNTGEGKLAELLGGAGAGMVLSRVVPRSDNLKVPVVRELIAAAKEAKLEKPSVYMLEGYLAARCFAEAARRAGKDLTRARFKKALEAMKDVDLDGFRVSFEGERVGSKVVDLSLIDTAGKIRE